MLTDEEINKIAQKVAQLLSTENTDNGNLPSHGIHTLMKYPSNASKHSER